MIAFHAVSTRRGPLALANVTLAWGPGVHAIASALPERTRALLALASGKTRPRRGRVDVLGRAPTDPRVRPHIAYVPRDVALPEAMRVDEVFALAAKLRGDTGRDASARLSRLGLEALTKRTVQSLSRAEACAVALGEALTSAEVRVVLLEEPWVALEPNLVKHLAEAIRAKANEGATVVFSTGSLRDANTLGDDVAILGEDGTVTSPAPRVQIFSPFAEGSHLLRLVVIAADVASAQALVSRLAHERDVEGLGYAPSPRRRAPGAAPSAVVVNLDGRDAVALANAVTRAAIAAEIDILQLHVEPSAMARDA